ncbi:MAG TPA: tRNA epoxyqueuosine(34) reductase QueG, partial [Gemmatimonadaceae bacterium]
AMNYGGTQPPGPIARYARGDDYHDVMIDRLNVFHRWIESEVGHEVRAKPYVDTGPILERDLAQRAGLGWIGKNTNLINPELGSFFFLGELLLDLELRADDPFETDRCGSCTRCLDACPTNAFVAPHVLDATKCISYQTIEQKGPIAETLREAIGEHLYGCDVCQDVCPYNCKFSRELSELALTPHSDKISPSPMELIGMSPAAWREFSRGSPIRRSKRRGFLRNTAVVLGNSGSADAVTPLIKALEDEEPLVRSHVAWALGRLGRADALPELRTCAASETDPAVLEALAAAIDSLDER